MSIDLDAIRQRNDRALYAGGVWWRGDDVTALLAEVDRLNGLFREVRVAVDQTDLETNEPLQAWLVGFLTAILARANGEAHE